jgi:hypothetical protein
MGTDSKNRATNTRAYRSKYTPPAAPPVADCDLVLPLGDGCVRLGWRKENGRIVKNIELPEGWKEAE